jgi:hypothetical protein
MKAARILVAISILGLSALAPSALADDAQFAWGFGYGSRPTYDGYLYSRGYPVYVGHDVTAIAVDLTNSRFRHRRVTGPGVVFTPPRSYWWW